jgi:hypothetical protein
MLVRARERIPGNDFLLSCSISWIHATCRQWVGCVIAVHPAAMVGLPQTLERVGSVDGQRARTRNPSFRWRSGSGNRS